MARRLVYLCLIAGLSPLAACASAPTTAVAAGTGAAVANDSVTAMTPMTPPLAVVLTTDCGVEMDDQWALAHLLLSHEIDLRAVVPTHASSIGFSSATSAKRAAEVIGDGL